MFLPLLLLLATSLASADFTCPSGYTLTNGYCWRSYSYLYTRDQAAQFCAGDGTALALSLDPVVNTAIANSVRSYELVFLGLKCNSSNVCLGDNGQSVNASSYFYGGYATPSAGQCVVMDTDPPMNGKWLSVSCSSTARFVCGVDPAANAYKNMQASKCGVPYKIIAPTTITSMNYPYNYDNNENCAYFLYGGPFVINFNYFYTESCCDEVTIYAYANNRPFGSSIYINTYAGNYTPFNVSIPYAAALITFVTDGSNTYQGFNATVSRA